MAVTTASGDNWGEVIGGGESDGAGSEMSGPSLAALGNHVALVISYQAISSVLIERYGVSVV